MEVDCNFIEKLESEYNTTGVVNSSKQLPYIFTKSLRGPKINCICTKMSTFNLYAPTSAIKTRSKSYITKDIQIIHVLLETLYIYSRITSLLLENIKSPLFLLLIPFFSNINKASLLSRKPISLCFLQFKSEIESS